MARKPKTSETTTVGNGGETHQDAARGADVLTTNLGIPISDNQNSLRAGRRGPSLLEDFVLREKIHHFDHERIPERIVHARGSAAHGYFELTKSLKKYTRAKVLTEVGVRTEVFARFSTVAGGAGSVDTPRDVRGFAVKLYTKEGNWDLVGNNIPVFFIQDAIKFPDLIHAVKMESDRGFPQAASAHDTFWDFISLMPESTHMIMWAMSDRAIPRSLRMMEGFGVHTFRLVDDNGASTFVKFHWKPKLGLQSTCWDEAVKIAGADPDYHRRDLFDSIAGGGFPEWELGVQLLTQEQADALPFDILDPTKLIPEEMVPIDIVGHMVLNRNPDNFFAETEQAAFMPTNVPPGIDFSEDPLLQGRLFSYLDTQTSRLGTTNWHELPINRAKGCPMHNFQRDGHMQFNVPVGRANYEPNSLASAGEEGGPRESRELGFHTFETPINEPKVRLRAETFADHYTQARLFFRSQSAVEQGHLASAITFELSKLTLEHVRVRVIANLRNVDEDLASRVAAGVGLKDLPPASRPAAPVTDMALAPSLRLIDKYPPTLKGRAVGILVTDGVDRKLIDSVKEAAEKAGATVKIIAPKVGGVVLKGGKVLPADGQLAGTPSVLFDAVALIVSEEGCADLMKDSAAIDFVSNAFIHLKAIGITAAAKPLLDRANVEPDASIVDVSSNLANYVKQAATRQWDREPKVRPKI
jgi:catalase